MVGKEGRIETLHAATLGPRTPPVGSKTFLVGCANTDRFSAFPLGRNEVFARQRPSSQ